MRKTKRLLSLLLTLAMLVTAGLPTVFAADVLNFSDVSSDYAYQEAITNLAAEGIINGFEDGTFKPEEPVTRAQFTKILCYAQNVGTIQYSEADRAKFPDVDPNHWAIHNITTARNSGIINGYDDGTFKPENVVLYEQAVKMAVCALGYTPELAERAGGTMGAYPNGYLSLASRAKLLNKISGVKVGQPLTRGRVAQLIDNMLDANMYNVEDGTTGDTMRDETSTRTSKKGRVVSVYKSSIYYNETSECTKDQIELELNNGDREIFGIAEMDIENVNVYLGRSVEVFYEEESYDDYYEAYNIAFQNKKNFEVEIDLDTIEDFSGSQLEYWVDDGEDTEKMDVDPSVIIMHNGQAVNASFADMIDNYTGKTGSVTLLCSTSADTADIAFFKTYETIVVSSAKDTKNYIIYDYYDATNKFVLDETDRNKTITFTKDGKPSKFSEIPYACIVSLAISPNGKIIDVQVSTKTQTGTITDMISDSRIKLDKTQDKLYQFSEACRRTVEISAGSYVTLHLDAFGKIAKYTVSSATEHSFGYLSWVEKGSGINPKVEVMIYKASASNSTPTGTIYALKDRVKIDGRIYTVSEDADEIERLLRGTAAKANINLPIDGVDPENADYAQPIRFSATGTVVDSLLTTDSTGEQSASLQLIHRIESPVKCLSNGRTLDKYTVSSSQVMIIPSDRTNGIYTTQSASSYFKKDKEYYVQFANVPNTNKPNVVYVYGTVDGGSSPVETLTESSVPMIVKNSSNAVYIKEGSVHDGELKKCLTLINTADGSTVKVYDDERPNTEALFSVVEGDVVRVAVDGDDMVEAIQVVAKAADVLAGTQENLIVHDGTSDNEDDGHAPLRIVTGRVHSVPAVGRTIIMAPSFEYPTTEIPTTYDIPSGAKVYVVNTARTEGNQVLTNESASSIVRDSKIMVFTSYSEVKAVVIFVNE